MATTTTTTKADGYAVALTLHGKIVRWMVRAGKPEKDFDTGIIGVSEGVNPYPAPVVYSSLAKAKVGMADILGVRPGRESAVSTPLLDLSTVAPEYPHFLPPKDQGCVEAAAAAEMSAAERRRTGKDWSEGYVAVAVKVQGRLALDP